MKSRLVLIIAAAAALCVPAALHGQAFRGEVEPTVKQVRAQYPELITPEQVGEILNAIAWAHQPNVKLLKKGGGGKCPAPHGVDISCDILIWAPPGVAAAQTVHVDVLSGASSEGLATAAPFWKSAGPCVKGPSSGCDMKNALNPISPGDVTAPPSPPPAAGDLQELAQRVRAIEERLNRHVLP